MNLRPILIQGAMESEIDYLITIINNKKETIIGEYKFYEGLINDYPVVVSKTKIGVINCSVASTLGITTYNPVLIINQGTAGSHSLDVHKFDIVLGNEVINITSFETSNSGEGQGINVDNWKLKNFEDDLIVKCDGKLLEYVENFKDKYTMGKIHVGRIGSGDIWNKEIDRIKFLNKEYSTICEDMESISSYTVADRFNIPIIGIRIISNNEMLNEDYEPDSAVECQKFVYKIAQKFIEKMGV